MLPRRVGIGFTHAMVQTVLAGADLEVLHIKGPALSRLYGDRPVIRQSMDTDVWVRASLAGEVLSALQKDGWDLRIPFEDGSSFEHAATMTHRALPSLDVHRQFPGIGVAPEIAFERLWRDRTTQLIAGIECTVPSLTAQRLILLLNTARGGSSHDDRNLAWLRATDQERQAVRDLAAELNAEVALAAAIGELDRYRDRREHDLWHFLSTGTGTPVQLWWARVRAEGNPPSGLRRGLRLIFPTPHRMRLAAGRELTIPQLIGAYAARIGSGMLSGWKRICPLCRGRQ
jgi:hypothetical protein